MSVSTALSLLAVAGSVVALLATLGLYHRLRVLEDSITDLAYSGPVTAVAPEPIRPRAGQAATLAAIVDTGCPLCHQVLEWLPQAAATIPGGVRLVAVTPPRDEAWSPADLAPEIEVLRDTAVWRGLYEGFTPMVAVITPTGQITDRVFIYADTDLQATAVRVRQAIADLRGHEDTTTPDGREPL